MRYAVELKPASPAFDLPDLKLEVEAESGTEAAEKAAKPAYVIRNIQAVEILPISDIAAITRRLQARAKKAAL